MHKKILTIICILLCLQLPNAPADTLLTNGGFENGTIGRVPSGWNAYTIRSTICVTDETSHSGTRALKIATDVPDMSQNYAFCYQKVSGIIAGAEYTASCYIKSLVPTTMLMKLQLYDGTRGIGEMNSPDFKATPDGWTMVSYTFAMPANCNNFEFYLRHSGTGTLYFDDVSLVMTKPPTVFWLEPEETFYYTEWETGSATVRLNPYYTQYGEGNYVMFRLLDGNRQIKKEFPKVGADNTATFTFQLSLLGAAGREYTLEATLCNGDYTPVTSVPVQTCEVFRYNRPESMTARGTLTKDGKDFVPVFMSGAADPTLFPYLAEIGVNAVNLPYYDVEPCYEAAVANGLSIIPLLYLNMKPAGNPSNINTTKAMVEKYKDDPNILGWKIMDEPILQKSSRNDLINSYKIIRDIDTLHPVMASEALWVDYVECFKYVDVLMPDSYPAGGNVAPTVYMTSMMKKAVAASKGRRGVLPYLQAISFGGYYPSGAEIVNMCIQSLAEGVVGFGFYKYLESFGSNTMADMGLTEPIGGFCSSSLQPLAAYYVLGKGTGLADGEDNKVKWSAWTAEDGTYLSIHSKLTTPVDAADIPLAFVTQRCKVQPVNSNFGIITAVNAGSLTVSLSAGGSLLYKLHTGEEGINLYRGMTELSELSAGDLTARYNGTGTVALAIYTMQNGAKELTALYVSPTGTVTVQFDNVVGISEVTAFAYQNITRIIAKKSIRK